MTGGNRPPRMQQPYRGMYQLLWRWLEKKYPEVWEDYKAHRARLKEIEGKKRLNILVKEYLDLRPTQESA